MSVQSALQRPHSLQANSLPTPIGIGDNTPLLSWKLSALGSGAFSTAWEIEAATTAAKLRAGEADLWASGKRSDSRRNACTYAGADIPPRTRVYWRVRVWDHTDTPSEWSEPTWFERGLTECDDWAASWIQSPSKGGPRFCPPAPFFRKEFSVDREIATARLYVGVLGIYHLEINGQSITERVLAPGWTDFRERIPVHTFDATEFLCTGGNVLGCVLGEGWFSGNIARIHRQKYGDRPALLAQLEIIYRDGTTETVASDPSWQTSTGPISSNDLLMGETYDAREELEGWSSPEFDTRSWAPVELRDPPEGSLHPVAGPFVQRHETITLEPSATPTKHSYTPWDGTTEVYDLGQNFTGRIRVSLRGNRGITLTLRHAEMLKPDGGIYTENLRTARNCDHYTLKGDGLEVYEPSFSVHGFRYVELSWDGGSEDLHFEKIQGIVIHSEMAPTGSFECSNPLLNQLQSNIVWGQKSNFVDVPTDCPQRDERMGWTGDAQVFAKTACFNFEMRPFFHKWMADVRDAQFPGGEVPEVVPRTSEKPQDGGPAWSDATVICPWTIWRCYGDTRILSDHYDSMRRYIECLRRNSTGLIRSHPEAEEWAGFGDWLALDGSVQASGHTLKDLIGTAFFAYDCELMEQIATELGHSEDAAQYAQLHAEIKAAFNRRFVTADGYIASNTQTSYLLALHFGLVPEQLRPAMAQNLVRAIKEKGMHLATGFVGTPYICQVLEEHGYLDVAYELLEKETFPSWLFSVKNGATTIWERWDGWTPEKGFQNPGMNSFNHYAYGAVGAWMYASVAGLDLEPGDRGYRKIRFRPRPGGTLTWAEATLETPLGRTAIRWERDANSLRVRLEVPVNAEATFDPPSGFRASATHFEPGIHDLLLTAETDA